MIALAMANVALQDALATWDGQEKIVLCCHAHMHAAHMATATMELAVVTLVLKGNLACGLCRATTQLYHWAAQPIHH